MAYFGTAIPTFYADGTQIVLPTPANRYEFTEKISEEYININFGLIVDHIGYRLVLRMEFVDLTEDEFDDVVAITEAKNVEVKIGSMYKSTPVKVTKIEGEMENKTTNELMLEVKAIKLFNSIPNADLQYSMWRDMSPLIYLPAEDLLNV